MVRRLIHTKEVCHRHLDALARRFHKATAVLGIVCVCAIANAQQASNNETDSEFISVEQELLDRLKVLNPDRVVMHYKDIQERLAMQVSSVMSSLGVENIELREVKIVPDNVQVRIFHSTDNEAAVAVADVLALVFDGVEIIELMKFEPLPKKGLLEVWLP